MSSENQNNNGFLYFIVGALLVAVAVLGFMYLENPEDSNNPVTTIVETTEEAADDVADEGDEFSLEIDEDGFSGSASSN